MPYSSTSVFVNHISIRELSRLSAPECANKVEEALGKLLADSGADISNYSDDIQTNANAALAHIVAAQTNACAFIDAHLCTQVELPLADPPPILAWREIEIMRYLLWDNGAPEAVEKRYEQALSYLDKVMTGRLTIKDSNETTVEITSDQPTYFAPGTRFAEGQQDACDFLGRFV